MRRRFFDGRCPRPGCDEPKKSGRPYCPEHWRRCQADSRKRRYWADKEAARLDGALEQERQRMADAVANTVAFCDVVANASADVRRICWTCAELFESVCGEWKCVRCILESTQPGQAINHSYFAGRCFVEIGKGEVAGAFDRVAVVAPDAWAWAMAMSRGGSSSRPGKRPLVHQIEHALAKALRSNGSLPDKYLRSLPVTAKGFFPPPDMRMCFCLTPFVASRGRKYCSSPCAKRAAVARELGVAVPLYLAAQALKAEAQGRSGRGVRWKRTRKTRGREQQNGMEECK